MMNNPLLRLRFAVNPYLPQILFSMLNLLALTALNLYIPTIIRDIIDEGLARADVQFLIRAALLLLGLGLLTAALGAFQRFLSEWISGHIGYDIRNRLYNHIQHMSFSFHDHAQTGLRAWLLYAGLTLVVLALLVWGLRRRFGRRLSFLGGAA